MRVHFPGARLNRISSNFLKLGNYLFDNIAFDIDGVEVLLEVGVGELVATLKLPVVITLLLDCVVSQMNKSICNILKIEVLATSPKVALIVPIALEVAINCSQHSVASNVKLSVLVKERLLNVFLDNVRPLLSVDISVRYNLSNLREFLANLNATASIGVFSRLDYPNLLP